MAATGYVVTESGGGEGTVPWSDVTGKPETFPPESHSHTYASVTGKPSTFPPDTHSHAYADVTGKPATFPPSAHSHDYAAPDHTHPAAPVAYADVTGKPSTFPPSAHGHAIEDVDDLTEALAEPARVYVHNGTSYVLSTTTDIFIGPADPGSGLWINTNA